MHAQAHTEGQHLQGAPNLQVAKALRQCCQLIVCQVPATVTAPLPISVTCQHSPPPCNPYTPLQHHCTIHAQANTEGQHLQGAPNLQVAKALRQCCQLIAVQVPATVTAPPPISVTCQHCPPRCNPAHPFSITAPCLHKHTHRGAALTGSPQPSGRQSSQAVLPADCGPSTCNRHRTPQSATHDSTAHLDATLAHPFSITAPSMHKHTQRGSTYRSPPTSRLPKLSGSVASSL